MIVKNTYINILGNVFGASIGFFTSIMLVRVYGVSVIGKIAYMTGLVGLMTFVLDLGIDQAGLKYISEKKDDFVPEFITYAFIKILLLTAFLVVASLSLLLLFKVDDPFLYVLIMGNIFLAALSDIFRTTFAARREFYQLNVRSNLARIVMLTFAICFCTMIKNWYYIVILPSIECLCFVIIATPYFMSITKTARWKIDRDLLNKYCKYALPLSLSSGLSLSIANLDKVFVGNLLTHTHVGYLAVAEKIFSVFDIIVKALTQQLLPEISYRMANFKEKQFKVQIEKIVFMANLMATFMVLFIILYADLLVRVIYGEGFETSGFILKMFSILIFVKLFFRPYHSLVFVKEKHILFLWFTIPTQTIRILLTYLMIPLNIQGIIFGGAASPLAKGFSWLFPRGLYILFFIKRSFKTLFLSRTKMLYPLFLAMGIIAVLMRAFIDSTTLIILGGLTILAAYLFILWVSGILDRDIILQIIKPLQETYYKIKRRKNILSEINNTKKNSHLL